MAGDWIKMRKSLLADPRVVRIMSALHADRFRTIGGLFSAWCLIDEQTEDGILIGYTQQAFDEIVGLDGIAEAMEAVGWLRISAQGIEAINFTEHNGRTAKRRLQENVRKMSARHADKCPQNVRTDVTPEKRREDIIEAPPLLDSEAQPQRIEKPPLAAIADAVGKITGTQFRWTTKRLAAVKARWTDEAWRSGWEDAIERAMGSSFLTGQNDRGWIMDLEFFLRPDTVTKILEGKYDDREGLCQTAEQKRERANAGVFDRIQAAADRTLARLSGSDQSAAPESGAIVFDEAGGVPH